jgi:RHS repeat-associated protein
MNAYDGDVLWRRQYTPYGMPLGHEPGDGERKGYTGHPHDRELGLIYMRARYYDPMLGRFLSPDPLRFVEDNPMSFNRYDYANGNPYRYRDPDGRDPQLVAAQQTLDQARERLRQIPEFAELESRTGVFPLRATREVRTAQLSPSNEILVNPMMLRHGYEVAHPGWYSKELYKSHGDGYWDVVDSTPEFYRFSPERVIVHETFHGTQNRGRIRNLHSSEQHEQEAVDFTNRFMYEHFGEPPRHSHGMNRNRIREMR